MATKTYVKPNGTEITVNDSQHSQDFAKAHGWKVKTKRKRKVKKDDNSD